MFTAGNGTRCAMESYSHRVDLYRDRKLKTFYYRTPLLRKMSNKSNGAFISAGMVKFAR